MIRELRRTDIDAVGELWLAANRQAHPFIAPGYWEDNLNAVKEMLPQAEVYVDEDGGKIRGFVGVNGEHIEGIFVAENLRSQGIGKRLLDILKAKKPALCLNVYQKNERAIRFYLREGFAIHSEGVDEDTGEKDDLMVWRRVRGAK